MGLKIDSEFIKAERQSRGWSQEQLAVAAGLGVRTIQRMESGSLASSESAKCVAAVFGVPFARLINEEPRALWSRRRLWVAAPAVAACERKLATAALSAASVDARRGREAVPPFI